MQYILVTGANRGIGREITRQLLAAGEHVLATTRHPGPTDTDLEAPPGLLQWQKLDIAEAESRHSFCNRLTRDHIQLKALINNAGVYTGGRYPVHASGDLMAVNFFGVRDLTLELKRLFTPGSRIINISSGMGSLKHFSADTARELLRSDLTSAELSELVRDYTHGQQRTMGWPSDPYSASKGALNALTRIWQRDWSIDGITTISICPDWVRTEMGGQMAPRSVQQGAQTPVWTVLTDQLTGGLFYRDQQVIDW